MIQQHYGIERIPFDQKKITLLPQQQKIFEILLAHCAQGSLCIVAGDPGTGKSILKQALIDHNPRSLVTASITRTLHTYPRTLRILCEAFQIDYEGGDIKCEKALIEETQRLHHTGKMAAILIDDAHLMDIQALRKLRLLLAEFPKNHNLILFAQAEMIEKIQLTVNEDIHSRITYSALIKALTAEDIHAFILEQFQQCGLPHNTISDDASALIARSSHGILRNAANITLSSLMETVRDHTHTITLKQVNAALMQPHWVRFDQLSLVPESKI